MVHKVGASEAKPTPLTTILRPPRVLAAGGLKLMDGLTRKVCVPLSEPHVTVIV